MEIIRVGEQGASPGRGTVASGMVGYRDHERDHLEAAERIAIIKNIGERRLMEIVLECHPSHDMTES